MNIKQWMIALGLFSFAFTASAADLKIGVVSVEALLQNSPQVQEINKKMQDRFSGPKAELEKLEKEIKDMQDKLKKDELVLSQKQKDDMKKDILSKFKTYREHEAKLKSEVESVRNQALAEFRFTVQNLLNKLAQEKNYDFVLSDGVAYAKKGYDLTPELLELLKKEAKSGK